MPDAARALRIGIDARDLASRPTGVGRYVAALVRRWTASQHRLVLYGERRPAFPDAANVERRAVPAAHAVMWEQVAWPRAMTEDRIDVAFCPAYACPLRWRGPRVTTLHDVSFFARPGEFGLLQGLRLRFFARRSAAASRAIVAVSDFTRREIGRYLGADALSRAAVIQNGPDDDLPAAPPRDEARRRLALSPTDRMILTVGSIFPRRNVDALVRALADVRARVPPARLTIVGDDRSGGRVDLRAEAARSGVTGSVSVRGFVTDDELATLYAAADAAAFLSDYEGFGLPALEALARGVPSVIGNRPSQSELFGAGGVLVEPRDASAVADALVRILSDEREADRLRSAGRSVASRFGWDRAASDTLELLERAAGGALP